MKIQIIGALGRVTGSATVLEHDNMQFIVDYGMEQGELPLVDIDLFDVVDIDRLKAVFLTHSHLDHCGLIPLLYKKGYTGPVISTKATSQLAPLIMWDSVKIGAPYIGDDINLINWITPDTFSGFNWGKPITLTSTGLKYYFQSNAHILGSVSIGIRWISTTSGKTKEILFSSDVGCNAGPSYLSILNNTVMPPHTSVDYLVCESTYGGRTRTNSPTSHSERLESLHKALKQTVLANKGNLFIPAFSLHRTQEIIFDLYLLSKTCKTGSDNKPQICVLVDSPLGNKVSEIYRKRIDDFIGSSYGIYQNIRLETLNHLNIKPKNLRKLFSNMYGYATFTVEYIYKRGQADKQKRTYNDFEDENIKIKTLSNGHIIGRTYPPKNDNLIIIASSGMMADGPMKSWIPEIITNEKATIAVTGYQAEGSIGNKLISMVNGEGGSKYISLGDDLFTPDDIKCKLITIDGYSGHADHDALVNYATSGLNSESAVNRTVILNHGSNTARRSLSTSLTEKFSNLKVIMPEHDTGWISL